MFTSLEETTDLAAAAAQELVLFRAPGAGSLQSPWVASSCCQGRRCILVVAAVGFVVEVDKTPWPGIKVSLSCKAQSVCQGFPHPLAGGVFTKTNSAVLDWNWNGVNSMKTAACHWQLCPACWPAIEIWKLLQGSSVLALASSPTPPAGTRKGGGSRDF